MDQITAQGWRNEYWRRRLLLGLMVPERYATVWISEKAQEHPGAVEALARLLTCPAQHDPLVNADGNCEWLRTTVDGVDFDLFVNCYAPGEAYRRVSDDPSDDDLTTRLYSLMLSSEYAEVWCRTHLRRLPSSSLNRDGAPGALHGHDYDRWNPK